MNCVNGYFFSCTESCNRCPECNGLLFHFVVVLLLPLLYKCCTVCTGMLFYDSCDVQCKHTNLLLCHHVRRISEARHVDMRLLICSIFRQHLIVYVSTWSCQTVHDFIRHSMVLSDRTEKMWNYTSFYLEFVLIRAFSKNVQTITFRNLFQSF